MIMTTTASRTRNLVNLKRRIIVAGVLLVLILISAVLLLPRFTQVDSATLSGRVLIWHAFSGPKAEALAEVLDRFTTLHPDVTIHTQAFASNDELLAQFQTAAKSGLGPDLLVGQSPWVRMLADANAIRAVDDSMPLELRDQYSKTTIQSLVYGDQLFGLPLSLEVLSLYHNKRHVETPARTLDDLLTQAAAGNTTLMSTDFRDAFWGVQAFGGRLFDEDGRAILDRGGYANWLDWLRTARDAPGMILDSNRDSLRERFLGGDAAYYTGTPAELNQIVEALGEENVGVTPLPSGPAGSAGPFLIENAIFFSPDSSPNQQLISIELGKFLTNAEQSATLMRKGRMVPANLRVRINPRLYPLIAGFSAQAATAVPVPNIAGIDSVWVALNETYNRFLEGIITAQEAAVSATAVINQANGIEAQPSEPLVCSDLGTVRLVHSWQGPSADALNAIIERFKKVCPMVIVQSSYEDLDALRTRWADNPTVAGIPDIVLAPQTWLVDALADEIALRDLSTVISSEMLQRYQPIAISGMRTQNRLLGVPMSVSVYALYYNESLINEPAAILDRLRTQADEGLPIALNAQFVPAYWGVGALGGKLFDDKNRVILDQGGFADWLTWLQTSRDEHGVTIVYDQAELKSLFLAGKSAYYVGLPEDMPELAASLGEDNLGLALLPAGPAGTATPFLQTTGFFFNGRTSDRRATLGAEFVAFATNADSQGLLRDMSALVPANATVKLGEGSAAATFIEQSRTAISIPNAPEMRAVPAMGDQAYLAVLQESADPQEAAADMTQQINKANGFAEATATEPPPTGEPASTEPAAERPPIEESDAAGTPQPNIPPAQEDGDVGTPQAPQPEAADNGESNVPTPPAAKPPATAESN